MTLATEGSYAQSIIRQLQERRDAILMELRRMVPLREELRAINKVLRPVEGQKAYPKILMAPGQRELLQVWPQNRLEMRARDFEGLLPISRQRIHQILYGLQAKGLVDRVAKGTYRQALPIGEQGAERMERP